jgi:hypothetical protein
MISTEALLEFKKVWLEVYGVELSDEEATALATNLLNAFAVVYRGSKREWLDQAESSVPP